MLLRREPIGPCADRRSEDSAQGSQPLQSPFMLLHRQCKTEGIEKTISVQEHTIDHRLRCQRQDTPQTEPKDDLQK